jgi:hypothetical protein
VHRGQRPGGAQRDASELKHLRGQCYHRLLINLGHLEESPDEIFELCVAALKDSRVRGECGRRLASEQDGWRRQVLWQMMSLPRSRLV